MSITYSSKKEFQPHQVFDLYESVGWTAYTKDLPKLLRALEKSPLLISAWDGEELVGLIRALTDGETIAYIQDILVKPAYQGKGIGDELMSRLLKELTCIRQIALMTDAGAANSRLHAWYESHGFTSYESIGVSGFAIFTNGDIEPNH
ncbi:MAG: GNAT family N-acetyltransferase [Anaerolineaceae bacterium]|jgi:ribosomal protein S18 acetylase RimI-like enzyme